MNGLRRRNKLTIHDIKVCGVLQVPSKVIDLSVSNVAVSCKFASPYTFLLFSTSFYSFRFVHDPSVSFPFLFVIPEIPSSVTFHRSRRDPVLNLSPIVGCRFLLRTDLIRRNICVHRPCLASACSRRCRA